MARAGSPWEASVYFHGSNRLHHSHQVHIIVELLLHHTSIIPVGLFFLTLRQYWKLQPPHRGRACSRWKM